MGTFCYQLGTALSLLKILCLKQVHQKLSQRTEDAEVTTRNADDGSEDTAEEPTLAENEESKKMQESQNSDTEQSKKGGVCG